MREALRELFTSLGVASVTFGSVAEYVASQKPDLSACLILDVELPDVSGLDFQRQLGDAYHPPIVFITGYGDIPSSTRDSSLDRARDGLQHDDGLIIRRLNTAAKAAQG